MRMDIRDSRRFREAPPQATLPAGSNQEPTRFAETAWPVPRVGTDQDDRIMHRVGAVAMAAQVLVHGRPFPLRALGSPYRRSGHDGNSCITIHLRVFVKYFHKLSPLYESRGPTAKREPRRDGATPDRLANPWPGRVAHGPTQRPLLCIWGARLPGVCPYTAHGAAGGGRTSCRRKTLRIFATTCYTLAVIATCNNCQGLSD